MAIAIYIYKRSNKGINLYIQQQQQQQKKKD